MWVHMLKITQSLILGSLHRKDIFILRQPPGVYSNKYRKTSSISHTKYQSLNVACILAHCLRSIHWSQVLSWERRCSWSSADRRCSNCIWVINNFIAYKGATYIKRFYGSIHGIYGYSCRYCCLLVCVSIICITVTAVYVLHTDNWVQGFNNSGAQVRVLQ